MKCSIIKHISTAIFVAIFVMFVLQPSKYMQCFFDGLTVWAHNVLPALFPFALLTTLYSKLQGQRRFSLSKIIFGFDCDSIFVTSLLCGYPVGAKAISDANLDKKSSAILASFCSTPSPIFVIATVGAVTLKSASATAIIIVSQLVACWLNGKTYVRKSYPIQAIVHDKFDSATFGRTLTDNVLAVLSVGGLVALFFMLSAMIQSILPSAIASTAPFYFVIGLLEMTNGILGICALCDLATATILTSSLLAFGGLCVFAQCYAFLSQRGVSALELLKMKITQSAYATLVAFALVKVFMQKEF